MIIVKIMGGLGNQMFQYAFARKLVSCGKQVKLDLSYYDKIPQGDTVRKYELGRFKCKIEIAEDKDISKYKGFIRQIYDLIGKYTGLYTPGIIVEDKEFQLSDILGFDNKYLIGYWQSEKYFEDIRDILMDELSFDKEEIGDENCELIREIVNASENSVSIHVRGGDYLNKSNAEMFGNICTNEYYCRACDYLKNLIGNVRFYLFTNDTEWVRSNRLLSGYDVKIIDWNTEDNSWIDMYLMSLCKHNIIANSSFSWWGAWLNRNPDKIVIAPSRWSNDSMIFDEVPKEWVKV